MHHVQLHAQNKPHRRHDAWNFRPGEDDPLTRIGYEISERAGIQAGISRQGAKTQWVGNAEARRRVMG